MIQREWERHRRRGGGEPKTEKKERKRNRGLREKQKATIGVGELREEMGGRLVTLLASSQKHKERRDRIRGRPKGHTAALMSPPGVLWLGRGMYKWQLSHSCQSPARAISGMWKLGQKGGGRMAVLPMEPGSCE